MTSPHRSITNVFLFPYEHKALACLNFFSPTFCIFRFLKSQAEAAGTILFLCVKHIFPLFIHIHLYWYMREMPFSVLDAITHVSIIARLHFKDKRFQFALKPLQKPPFHKLHLIRNVTAKFAACCAVTVTKLAETAKNKTEADVGLCFTHFSLLYNQVTSRIMIQQRIIKTGINMKTITLLLSPSGVMILLGIITNTLTRRKGEVGFRVRLRRLRAFLIVRRWNWSLKRSVFKLHQNMYT